MLLATMKYAHFLEIYQELIAFLGKGRLSEEESACYICLLLYGNSSVSALSRSCGINRTKLYGILKKLESAGMVSQVSVSPVGYEAVPLETCVSSILNEYEHQLIDLRREAAGIIRLFGEKLKRTQAMNAEYSSFKLRFIGGTGPILNTITRMVSGAMRDVAMLVDGNNMHRIESVLGTKDSNSPHTPRIRIITDPLLEGYAESLHSLDSNADILRRYHDISVYPNFISADGTEMFVFLDVDLTRKYVNSDQQTGFWVSDRHYISRMMKLFEKLWSGQAVQQQGPDLSPVAQLKQKR